MRGFVGLVLLLLASLWGSGMASAAQPQYCHLDAAYAAGMNDGRHNRDMLEDYAKGCVKHQHKLNKRYRQGYQFGLRHQGGDTPKVPYSCHDSFGKQVCGYHCKSFAGNWTCADKPNMQCLQNMNDIKCGYSCKEEFGQIQCQSEKPRRPHHKYECHSDPFGHKSCGYDCKEFTNRWVCAPKPDMSCMQFLDDIQCGYNCRKEYGQIKCDPS